MKIFFKAISSKLPIVSAMKEMSLNEVFLSLLNNICGCKIFNFDKNLSLTGNLFQIFLAAII